MIDSRLPDLTRTFCALLIRRPSVNFEHYRALGSLIWRIRWSPCVASAVSYDGTEWSRVDPAERDFARGTWKIRSIPVARPLPPLFAWATEADWAWLTWRPALYMYLFLFAVVVATLRAAKWQYLVVAVPVVVQASIMTFVVTCPEFRYHWSVYLAGMLCSGFLLLGVPLRRTGTQGDRL